MSATEVTQAVPAEKRRRLPLVAAVVAIAAVAAGGYLVLGRGDPPEAAATAPAEGEVVEVATMTVNLAGPGMRYARVGFAAVLAEGADPTLVASRAPLLRDAALTEVGAYTAEDLTAPEGVERLRAGLTERARALFPDGELVRVVLTELVVQ